MTRARDVADRNITADELDLTDDYAFTGTVTGAGGGKLAPLCDVLIDVPSNEVASIQEMHLPIYHEICRQLESHYFTAYSEPC